MSGFDPSPQADRRFEEIEAAVLETARGRWFLAECARRNRAADTAVLLDAIGRLEGVIDGRNASEDVAREDLTRLREDLSEMSGAIRRMKSEVSQDPSMPHGSRQLLAASQTLDGIVRMTETATSAILDATEHIQEAAWSMREQGADARACDALDHRATEIYSACEFQDLTAQRTRKVVQMLGFLEDRIAAMSRAWGAEGSDSLPRPGEDLALTQSDIDFVIVDRAPPDERPRGEPPPMHPAEDVSGGASHSTGLAPATEAQPRQGDGLDEIDRLSIAEKLRRFT